MSENATEGVKPRTGLALRWPEFERLCSERNLGDDLPEQARSLGVSYQQLHHLRSGRSFLGADTIDALISLFGADNYAVLVERVERPQKAGAR